ncbi:hypothetical protein HD806DRAFT_546509 [Xylariaceae sp. AK1471]|nr:hypothetical protein HD806DRAFT_546509 [Xylariaceae sp. AK1471]
MATTTIFEASKSLSRPQLGFGQAHYPATSTPNPVLQSNSPKPSSLNLEPEHYRLLKKGEWLQFCRGIGILKDEESEEVIRATSRLWPPSGFKDGLYSDGEGYPKLILSLEVILEIENLPQAFTRKERLLIVDGEVLYEKTKFTYFYRALSTIVWLLMLLQLALSAILTSLGATSRDNGTPITAIAAINTGVSGILALMHNSGLPDRYRSDRNEFYKIEEHIKAIVDSGLVPLSHSVNDVLAECFEMFATALQTVENNAPSTYALATGPRPPASAAPLRASQRLESEK